MRAGTVLAGMLVAALAGFLIWFDATGQLRPFLSTAPTVVIELDPRAAIPDPQIAAAADDPAESGSVMAADAVPPDASGDASSAPPPPKPDDANAADNVVATDNADAAASDATATETAALPTMPSGADLPWRRYAGEFSVSDPRPRIAIVFTSLGLSDAAGDAIIAHMPPGVTLAFSPYSRKLTEWIARARSDGHEALIELPMEPLNYPEDDPGPLALLSTLPVQDNITRMDSILARSDGVVGVAVHMGSRFTTSAELMRPILEALGERGYLYVDNGAAPFSVLPTLAEEIALPMAVNNHYIDREASRIAIDGRLQQIERIARSEGAAVAFASPYPITIERLAAWIPTLEAKGFVLAPITAVVGRQRLQ
ncbi:MAG: divergent polysaccharide deacetylase family protein [Dongiaceae bacterium]